VNSNEPPPQHHRAEDLLAHADWLRRLSRSLVRDGADDLVQDTWISALRHPPRREQPPAPWLSRVLRNAARSRRRSDDRRTRRELERFEPRHEPGSDETVVAIETQRVLLDAVEALAEPLRSTVVRHYFHGRTSIEIARDDGVADSTVRTRLRQAVEELRRRLDDRHDGSRAAWVTVLEPWARRAEHTVAAPTVTVTVLGGIAMSTIWKFGFAAVLLALLTFGVVRWTHDVEPTTGLDTSASSRTSESASASPVADLDPIAATPARVVAAASERPADTPPRADLAPATVEARLIDSRGLPIAGGRLTCRDRVELDGLAPELAPSAASSADGRVTLTLRREDASSRRGRAVDAAPDTWTAFLTASATGCAPRRVSIQVKAGGTHSCGDVALLDAGHVAGRIVDERGNPLESVGVNLGPPEMTVEELEEAAWFGPSGKPAVAHTSTDVSGSYAFSDVPVGTYRAWTQRPGRLTAVGAPFTITKDCRLELPDLVAKENVHAIRGRVLRSDGTPCPKAAVRFGANLAQSGRLESDRVTTDETGAFTLNARPASTLDLQVLVVGKGRAERSFAAATAVPAGTTGIELRLDALPIFTLDVQDSSGTRIENYSVKILASDGEYDGYTKLPAQPTIFSSRETPYSVVVGAPGFRSVTLGPLRERAVPSDVVVKLERSAMVRVSVRANGQPVGNARLSFHERSTNEGRTVNGFPVRLQPARVAGASTGPDGTFDFEATAPSPRILVVRAKGHATWESQPLDWSGSSDVTYDVELTAGGRLVGTVRDDARSKGAQRYVTASRGDGVDVSTLVGEAGEYVIEHLAPGAWWVRVTDRDYTAVQVSRVNSRPETDNVETRIEDGATTKLDLRTTITEPITLEGRVRVPGLEPTSWTATLVHGIDRSGDRIAVGVAVDGTYRLIAPETGANVLRLQSNGSEWRSDTIRCVLDLKEGVQRRDVELATGTLNAVTTRDELVQLDWTSSDGSGWACQWRPSRTEALLLTGVPAGHVVLRIGDRVVAECNVRAGETSNVDWR